MANSGGQGSSAASSFGTQADATDADFNALREDLAKLTQTVTQLVQNQANSTRDQVMGAVNSASDTISQSASAAQDKFMSLEADLESRVQQNPIAAIAIALGIGLLLGKMS